MSRSLKNINQESSAWPAAITCGKSANKFSADVDIANYGFDYFELVNFAFSKVILQYCIPKWDNKWTVPTNLLF